MIYSAAAGRVGRSWVSGPILFTAVGLILGPAGAGLLHLNISAADLRTIAELALAMVLFTDAAHADLGVVRHTVGLPERLLLIGLPLTIVLGLLAALVIFPGINPLEAGLIATLLAPTDAALGAPVVTNQAVPAPIREALNLESGLNDGICVPVVVLLLDFAVGREIEGSTLRHILTVVIEEIGIGLLSGLALSGLAVAILRLAARRGARWRALAAHPGRCAGRPVLCRRPGARGQRFHRLLHWRAPVWLSGEKEDLLGGAASTGEVLALVTWVAFGGPVLARLLERFTWSALLYAVLSLTVIRMLPVLLSLRGAGLSARETLFIGWFGPRGLASIVFAVIVFDAGLPGRDTIAVTTACTVLLSVIAHGITATPLARVLGRGRREAN